jgi:hypothetical protein
VAYSGSQIQISSAQMKGNNSNTSKPAIQKPTKKGLGSVFAGAIAEKVAGHETKKKFGLSESDLYILIALGECSRAARAYASAYRLGKITGIHVQTTYMRIKPMQQAGFVELVAANDGIRGKQFGLTGLGWLVLRHWERVYREREKYLLNNARKMRALHGTFEYAK